MTRLSLASLGTFFLVATLLPLAQAMKFAFVSDFHYDPFYRTPLAEEGCTDPTNPDWGMFNCDSPYRLVASAAKDVITQTKPDYIVCGGDWLRHEMKRVPSSVVMPTFKTVTGLWKGFNGSVLPAPNFATPLGNNDFVPDYRFVLDPNGTAPADPLLQNMSKWLLEEKLLEDKETETFSKFGFYSRRLKGTKIVLVVLNSLLWSEKLNPYKAAVADPGSQLAFLEAVTVAAAAEGRAVWIVSHIPPGVNLYDVSNHPKTVNPNGTNTHYWQRRYETSYLTLLAKYNATIKLQLFAHTHHFMFSGDLSVAVPMIVLPAVSPIYFNWPNYFSGDVDPATGELLFLNQRYFNMTSQLWLDGPDFAASYKVPSTVSTGTINTALLNAIGQNVMANKTALDVYRRMNSGNIITDKCTSQMCQRSIACYLTTIATDEYFACLWPQ